MQDVTPWPASFDVSEPVARVLVDGQEVDVESVSVTSELDSAMPERVAAGGGGVVAATGSARILPRADLSEHGFNPWGDAAELVDASEIVVEAGYRDTETGEIGCARQVTAQADDLSGGVLSLGVGLDFMDHTPLLDREITIEPLLFEYPPLEDFGPKRGAGLNPLYVVNRVLRHCGFYTTPPQVSGAVVSAPLVGSAWPERGTLLGAQAEHDASFGAQFGRAPWGHALINGHVRYIPNFGSRGHGRMSAALSVSFCHRFPETPVHGDARIDVMWGSANDAIRVQMMGNGSIVVRYRSGGSSTTVVTLPAADVAASEIFTVIISDAGHATIHASNGASVTGQATLPAHSQSTSMTQVFVWVPDGSHLVGGLQVAFGLEQVQGFERNAHFELSRFYHSIRAFPSQIDVNCLDLLKSQAEAELAAIWIDEFGHFRWRHRQALRESEPQGVLTSQENLLDLQWQVPIRSVYSRVDITHDVPTITRRRVPSITVSDSGGSTLSNLDVENKFFEPPANQDWHQVDDPAWMGASSSYNLSDLRRGRGSYRGGVIVDDDNNERLAYSSRLHQTWTRIGSQRWLMASEARELLPSESVEQAFLDRPDWYGRFAEEKLPIIRAKGLVEWDQDTTTGVSRGPRHAPVKRHAVGAWVQDQQELQLLANWLATHLTTPDVILRDVPIVPDPRIQLGDVFWLEDTTAYHVRLRVVIMGKTLTYQASESGYEMAQKVTCRILEVQRLQVKYAELATAWEGHDYDEFQSAWDGHDYDTLDANPLDRRP